MAHPVALSENHSDYFNAAHLPEANGASTRKTAMVALAAFALFGASISLYAGEWMVAAPIAVITVFSVGATVFAVSIIALAALGYVHRSEYQKRQKALREFTTLGFVAYRAQYVPKTISERELNVLVNEEASKATSFRAFINQHSSAALGYLESGPKGHLKTLLMNEMNGLETTALIAFAAPVEFSADAEIMSVRSQILVSRFSSLNLSALEATQRQQLIDCIGRFFNDADKANFKIKLFSSYGPDKVLDLYRDYKRLFNSGLFKAEDLFIGSKQTLRGAFDTACAPLSASQILEFGKELFTQRFLTRTVSLSDKLDAYIVENASDFLASNPDVIEDYASTGLKTLLVQTRGLYQEYARVCKSNLNKLDREHKASLEEKEQTLTDELSRKSELLQLKAKKLSYDTALLREVALRKDVNRYIAQQNQLEREGLFCLAIPEGEIRRLQSEVSGQSALSPREIESKSSQISSLLKDIEPLILAYGHFSTSSQIEARDTLLVLKSQRETHQAILSKKGIGISGTIALFLEKENAKAAIVKIDKEIRSLRRRLIAEIPVGSTGDKSNLDASRCLAQILSLEQQIAANDVLIANLQSLQTLQARKKAIEDAIAKKAELDAILPDLRSKLVEAQATLVQVKDIFDLANSEYQLFEQTHNILFERSKKKARLDLENLKNKVKAALSRDVKALTVEFKRKATPCLEAASVESYPAPSAPLEASTEFGEDNPTIVE